MARKRMGFLLQNERNLSVAVLGLIYAWVLAVPFEGRVLYALAEFHHIGIHAMMYSGIAAHCIGLFSCGFFLRSMHGARLLLFHSALLCMTATGILCLPPSLLWPAALIVSMYASGVCVAAWGYYFKNGAPPKQRIKTVADVLLFAGGCMIVINIVAIRLSPYAALVLGALLLLAAMWLAYRLPSKENDHPEAVTDMNQKQLNKTLAILYLFIAIAAVDGGLMFQVVNPAFAHLVNLTCCYWILPYMAVILIMRNVPENRDRFNSLYIGIAMYGFSILAFFNLESDAWAYLLVNTLLMGAGGIFNIFWWTSVGKMLSLHHNPALVFGTGLSAGTLGLFVGGCFGKFITANETKPALAGIVALSVAFFVLMLLPLLHERSSKLLNSYDSTQKSPPVPEAKQDADAKPFGILSVREHEVMMMLLKGYTYRAIAENLHLSENTVKTYVKNIYSNLNIHNRTELIRLVNETP